jgi:autophagy-related protein 16-1
MQEELTSLLREKASDKQTIIACNDQIKLLQATVSRQADELNACRESLAHHKEALREKQKQVEDCEQSVATTAKELMSKNLEIERQREQIHKLQSENNQLVQHIKGLKEAEADKHNELVIMNEEIEKKKREAELLKGASSIQVADASSTGMIDALSGRDRLLSFGSARPTTVKSSILAHERAEIHTVAHNASGSMLLTGSDDRTVRLWDSRSGTRLSSLEIAVKAVMCVGFSQDGHFGLAASGDLSVRVWNLKTSRVMHTLTGHTGKIYTARFTPDSKGVFSSGYDRKIKLWELAKGLVTGTMDCSSSCNDAAITRDGAQIISAHLDASIRFWDVRTAQFAHELSGVHSQPITSVLVHPTNPNQVPFPYIYVYIYIYMSIYV